MLVIQIIFYLEELLKILLVYLGLLNFKFSGNRYKKYVVILFGIVAAIITTVIYDYTNSMIGFLFVNILFVITLCLFDGKWTKKILLYIPIYSIVCVVDILVAAIRGTVVNTAGFTSLQMKTCEIISSIVGIGVWMVIVVIKHKFFESKFYKQLTWHMGLLITSSIIITCVFMTYSKMLLQNSMVFFDRILNLVFIISWIGFLVGVFILLGTLRANEEYKIRLEINNKLTKDQEEYYDILYKKNETLKKFRHDYKNHLSCIRMFAERKDYLNLMDYMNGIELISKDFLVEARTGNAIVDVVLSDVTQRFKDRGVLFEVSGMFPDNIKISNVDMSIIFSNAFINAAEASEKVEQQDKTVEISIKTINGKCIIQIVNPIAELIKIEDGMIKTNKEDKDNHGFGIMNIRTYIEKNCGILEYEIREDYFLTNIIL